MKERKKLITGCICLALATCLCLAFIHMAGSNSSDEPVTIFQEEPVTELDLSGTPVANLEKLITMTELEHLNLRGTGLTIEQYDMLHAALSGCEILWDVPFQGKLWPNDRKTMHITSLTDEDVAVLAYFPLLNHVYADDCTDYAQLQALRSLLPHCQVDYAIRIGGKAYPEDTAQLTVPGADAAALTEVLAFFPNLQSVTLQEPLDAGQAILALEQAYPQVSFDWTVTFKDMVLPKNEITTLDLTNIPTTVEEIEALLPYLPNLTYVDMTDCGIDNESMDALNRRHENVKIVWTVDIGNVMRVRTDETWFMPGKWSYWVHTDEVYNLRYCTDMICVDIGHMPVADCEWARFMPKLQFFLICDTHITDISPLTGLQDLKFVELFLNDIVDYTPLLTCPSLEDVNLHYTYGDPEVVKQLTWINNLWWRNTHLTEEQRQELREALPNTRIEFWVKASTGAGWRKLPNYFEQRDIMGMFYMD